MRRQLPVSSPIRPLALARAIGPAISGNGSAHEAVAATLARSFGARRALLTDSGTSALVLALRLAAGRGGTVAFPSYGCIDLTAAALYAGIKVRLYDIDPHTLSADLDSLDRALTRGADAVLVAYLYGYPVDMAGVVELAESRGIPVIEDAAQGAGGTLAGRRLGGFGPLTVLSFGRGKGTTGGNGGALLAHTDDWARRLEEPAAGLGDAPSGWRDLIGATAQWVLGRPSLYPIPSAIPGLKLGEMVYHPAGEPRPLSRAAATLVTSAFEIDAAEVAIRRENARALLRSVTDASGLRTISPVAGAEPGYLRFPVLADRREPAPDLGVLRAYPKTLMEHTELEPNRHPEEREQPGAVELRRSLLTMPTHGMVTARDMDRLKAWIVTPQRASE
jgi:perosamine synthetase